MQRSRKHEGRDACTYDLYKTYFVPYPPETIFGDLGAWWGIVLTKKNGILNMNKYRDIGSMDVVL